MGKKDLGRLTVRPWHEKRFREDGWKKSSLASVSWKEEWVGGGPKGVPAGRASAVEGSVLEGEAKEINRNGQNQRAIRHPPAVQADEGGMEGETYSESPTV